MELVQLDHRPLELGKHTHDLKHRLARRSTKTREGRPTALSLEKTVQHLSSAGDRSLARTFSHFEQTGLRANDHTVETSSIGKRPVSRSASVGSQFGKTSRICFAVIRLRYGCCFRNFLIISESICRSASQS